MSLYISLTSVENIVLVPDVKLEVEIFQHSVTCVMLVILISLKAAFFQCCHSDLYLICFQTEIPANFHLTLLRLLVVSCCEGNN